MRALFLGAFEAVAAMAAFFFVLAATGWHWGQQLAVTDLGYRQATTACLTAIVLMQVVNVHVCRSRRTSILSRPLFGNALITAGIVAEVGLILAIDYTAFGNAVFGTAAIGYEAWLVVLPFAVAMLALDARKAFVRWRETHTPGSIRAKGGDIVMLNDLRSLIRRRSQERLLAS